mmetsp:Transcript_30091/g.68328  ORF Transcript_30091/g.68328 Transcript_30091/m.68328 type:complete len:111 (-) Transcript_30091:35-367(-)
MVQGLKAAGLLAAAALLSAGPTGAITVSTQQPASMDNHKCKVLCQRFGMRALGEAFQGIRNPTECVRKCDEVYTVSMLQASVKPPPAAPHPAAPRPSKHSRPQAAAPVKR